MANPQTNPKDGEAAKKPTGRERLAARFSKSNPDFNQDDDEAIYAGYELTRMDGIIPAIESAHAIAALKQMTFKKDDVVVLTVSGRGDKDVETYLSHKEMAKEYGNF